MKNFYFFYQCGGLKFVGKTARRSPDEQVRGSSRLFGLNENLVLLALNLKVRAAGRRHGDGLVKFQDGQMVQCCSDMNRTERRYARLREAADGTSTYKEEEEQTSLHGPS